MTPYDARPRMLLAALVLQGLPAVLGELWVFGICCALVVVMALRRYRLSLIARWFRGPLILLPAILLARSIAGGFRAEVYPWALYSLRLLTALGIALVTYREMGLVSIIRSVSLFARFIPGMTVRRFIEDTLASFLFLFPVVSLRLRTVREAYILRRARPGYRRWRRSLNWTGRLFLVYISSVAALPRGRAEALLLRESRWS